MSEAKANFGMIGLAVMGRNLALNVADHGFKVAVWNLETPVMEAFGTTVVAVIGREPETIAEGQGETRLLPQRRDHFVEGEACLVP